MSDFYLGEVRIFAGNFAPRGWALCNGQLMSIQQNVALFSIIGTYYGGNGTTNFALPNLQGHVAVGPGQGPGLSTYVLGETIGSSAVTLNSTQLPSHNHVANASSAGGNAGAPATNTIWAASTDGDNLYASSGKNSTMAMTALSPTGGNQPHNNMQPFLVLNYIIALIGIFPSRS
jgi:microcystin-dependent protein